MLPELEELHGVEQSRYHHLDVYGHTLEVLAQQIELEGGWTSTSGTALRGSSRAGRAARRTT